MKKVFSGVHAVNDVSLTVAPGEIVGLIGANGAGKSTTLKMLTGMLAPSSGRVALCGIDLAEHPCRAKRRLGFVPDSAAVFESLTGMEYLDMVASLYGLAHGGAAARAQQFFSLFGLTARQMEDEYLGAYSKGTRRKVAIIAGLMHDPDVIFFDEPLDGLDANTTMGFKQLLRALADRGKSILYSSHLLDVVERSCDRILVMQRGQLVLDGAPGELMQGQRARTLENLVTALDGGRDEHARAAGIAEILAGSTDG